MPTQDIIGYLWSKRQELDLYSVSDVLQMTRDLNEVGLSAVSVSQLSVLGIQTDEVSVVWDRRTPDEWAKLVENAIAKAAVEHTSHMFQGGEFE